MFLRPASLRMYSSELGQGITATAMLRQTGHTLQGYHRAQIGRQDQNCATASSDGNFPLWRKQRIRTRVEETVRGGTGYVPHLAVTR